MTQQTARADAYQGNIGLSLVILLALLTALDAMAIDMYLPGMPMIAQTYGVSAGSVQQTLSVFLAGLALGQCLYGPLLERFGRRMPLMVGLVIFVAGSVAAAMAPTLEWLLVARFAQAIGAAAGLVAPRAIVADLCDVKSSARIFSLLMQVMMIAPVVAPMMGGFMLEHGGWRGIFWVLAVLGITGLVWGLVAIPESLDPERRVALSVSSVVQGYLAQSRRRVFMAYTLAGGFVLGSLFTYISAATFVFTEHFGMTPTHFSYLFAANSVGLILGGTLANILAGRGMTPARVTYLGLGVHALAGGLLALAVAAGMGTFEVYVALLALAVAALGLVFGNLTALTMNHGGRQAGVASALMGTLHYLLAAGVGYVVSLATQGPALMPLTIAICGVMAIVMCVLAGRLIPREAGE
ncbi:multidrug effflux MFS transporter [Kushneria indalinina]|uniref:Bcr/CflA family efflux transporter n=1 Tax=Kushneria indalinina DSM 14324 TaxID=1122140 RepID=A0A3D9DXT0_9GAMM|nr:multidrug effflux MFS transporter [Kushneria indalinina]REC95590.1 DHA1 family bicyclomycin/chloramphenicol resistance-like MFS transporter [Kushneria indalinina DSM 14324]